MIKSIKVLTLFLVCLLFMTINFGVNADMMFDNNMDDFYNSNSDKCENVNKIYTANGTKGYIIGWKSPNSMIKAAELTNGKQFDIHATYKDKNGVNWGLSYEVDYNQKNNNVIFWVPMSELKEGNTTDVITPVNPPVWLIFYNFVLVFLIALVIVVTIILIRLFWRKNKRNNLKTDVRS